jgi:hypothetical protein
MEKDLLEQSLGHQCIHSSLDVAPIPTAAGSSVAVSAIGRRSALAAKAEELGKDSYL